MEGQVRYLLAAVALAMSPSPANASAWRLAATGHSSHPREYYSATFVDTATIRRERDSVRFSSLSVWEENISSGDNSRLLTSADCRDHSFQHLEIAHYKGGAFVEKGLPAPRSKAVWESALYRAIDAACGARPWLTKVVKDPYRWSRSAFRKLHSGGHWPLDIGR
ncbi:MAG TPA: surface-adhesin E family protein [Allosphingosinicella sp.]|jgi:hypothetical protein